MKPFFASVMKKTTYEIALQFVKNNNQGRSFFDFDEKKELKNIDLALQPIQFTCICDPTNSFTLHTKNSILQHFGFDKHKLFRNESIKQSSTIADGHAQTPIAQQESEMIERAKKALQNRLKNEKYECPCGSSLTIESTCILRDHFKTKKHKTNIQNTKMELKNRGVIL